MIAGTTSQLATLPSKTLSLLTGAVPISQKSSAYTFTIDKATHSTGTLEGSGDSTPSW